MRLTTVNHSISSLAALNRGNHMGQLKELPLFPLHTVLFPGMVLPLHIFEPRYRQMIGECIKDGKPFGVALIQEGVEAGGPAVPYQIGTSAYITQVEQLADGRMNIFSIGYQRFRVHELRDSRPYLVGLVEDYPFAGEKHPTVQEAVAALIPPLRSYIQRLEQATESKTEVDKIPEDGLALALLTAILLPLPAEEKQGLLESSDLTAMLQAERALLRRESMLLNQMLVQDERRGDSPTTLFSNN
jgi:Lon protease-like protein